MAVWRTGVTEAVSARRVLRRMESFSAIVNATEVVVEVVIIEICSHDPMCIYFSPFRSPVFVADIVIISPIISIVSLVVFTIAF